jgi:hypothetical protein
LNAIGLVLNMVGVVLLFFYANPQPSFIAGAMTAEDSTQFPAGAVRHTGNRGPRIA